MIALTLNKNDQPKGKIMAYGLYNRSTMAKRRGELHLGQSKDEHVEYQRFETAIPELKDKMPTKNPRKGDDKG